MYKDMTLVEYIKETSSVKPAPGGGSVNGLVASLAAALTRMTAFLTFGKDEYESLDEDIRREFQKKFDYLEELEDQLIEVIDEDTKAFGSVLKAYKMPKETEEDKKARSMAIQEGYKRALDTPKKCGRLALEIMRSQEVFVDYGNKNLVVDTGVGIVLAYAALEASMMNITTNMGSIKDEEYKKETNKYIDEQLKEGLEIKEALLKKVYKII